MTAHFPRWLRAACAVLVLSPQILLATPPDGRELFTREWLPNDPRSAAGDGLGPVFNDTSCVGCHNQGAVGGAGPRAKNVVVATVFGKPDKLRHSSTVHIQAFSADNNDRAASAGDERRARIAAERQQLVNLHPAFLNSRSIVLQRFSVDVEYGNVLEKFGPRDRHARHRASRNSGKYGGPREIEDESMPKLLEQQRPYYEQLLQETPEHLAGGKNVEDLMVLIAERSTPPLFGSGRIDAIADAELLAAADQKFAHFPEVSGRVARLADGKLGRFGWKAQQPNLREFVLGACALELGLDVPGHPQALAPHRDNYTAPGLDMTADQCDALVSFVAALPTPQQIDPEDDAARKYLASGRRLFESVGCAACHLPDLGKVKDIYSDLLLHDMGRHLSDFGAYNTAADGDETATTLPLPAINAAERPTPRGKAAREAKQLGAQRQEWRTPPLWGLRDSAPYLHDGRAETIEQAIALHEGEALRSSRLFLKLPPEDRLQLVAFLRSLAAPE